MSNSCFYWATLWYCHNKKKKTSYLKDCNKSEIYECKQGEAAMQSTDRWVLCLFY